MSDTNTTGRDDNTAAEPPDTCSYCATPFEDDDIFWVSQPNDLTDGNPVRIARCKACTGVHAQSTCGRCNTEAYHPTVDNTPWGERGCRVCQTPDPFTHLLGFVAGIVINARDTDAALTRVQTVNTALVEDLRELRRINTAVHQQMARMHNPVTHARMAKRAKDQVSTNPRVLAEMFFGRQTFSTVGDIVEAAYLAGVAMVLGLKDAE